MPADVGERFLNDPVGGTAHRGRYGVRLPRDREGGLQAGAPEPFHEAGDVVEAVWRGGVVVAQRLQGRPQLPAGLPAGLLDREQGLRHRLAAAPGHMHGDLGLHLDDRDLMGEGVVQFPCDAQPFLVGPTARGLLTGPLGLVRAPFGLPYGFSGGERGDQPGELKRVPGLRQGLARAALVEDQRREVQHGHQHHRHNQRDLAVSGAHRAVDRDQAGNGERVEPGCQMAHRAHAGDGQHAERRPPVRGQCQPAGHQQHGAEHPEPSGRVGPGQAGAQHQRRHAQGGRPRGDSGRDSEPSFVHGCTVTGRGRRRIPLVEEPGLPRMR
ncbi:hypothetical protein SUDANB21_06755 [Streptomyces sp. enrichment culture]